MNKHAHDTKTAEKVAPSQPAPEAAAPAPVVAAATTGTAVATYNYASDDVTGFEGATSQDFVVPLLDVLQAQSPEIVGSTIEGARPGMLICRAISEVFDCNNKPLIILPVGRQHVMNEWRTRETGGGLVTSHDPNSPAMKELKSKQPFGKIKLQSGNEIQETYYLFAILVREDGTTQPVSIPFWSTKINQYKALMTKANGLTYDAGGGARKPYPTFAHKYRMTTFLKEKNSYKWWAYKDLSFDGKTAVEARLDPKGDLYQTALAFALQVKQGIVKADMAAQAPEDDADASAHVHESKAAAAGGKGVGADGMPF